jgi:hypothetical protein
MAWNQPLLRVLHTEGECMNQETPQTAPANASAVMAIAAMATKTFVIGLEWSISNYYVGSKNTSSTLPNGLEGVPGYLSVLKTNVY